MTTYYPTYDEKTGEYCVVRRLDGKKVASCDSEDWSCFIAEILNLAAQLVRSAPGAS